MAPEPQTEACQIPVENIMYVPASCVRWVRALRYRSLTRIGWPSSCLDQPVLARRFWPSSITSPTKGPNIYLINAPWVAFMDRCDLACSFRQAWYALYWLPYLIINEMTEIKKRSLQSKSFISALCIVCLL